MILTASRSRSIECVRRLGRPAMTLQLSPRGARSKESNGERAKASSRFFECQYLNGGRQERMTTATSDTKREMLRHTAATLAYRGRKAVRGANDAFASFKAAETTRT